MCRQTMHGRRWCLLRGGGVWGGRRHLPLQARVCRYSWGVYMRIIISDDDLLFNFRTMLNFTYPILQSLPERSCARKCSRLWRTIPGVQRVSFIHYKRTANRWINTMHCSVSQVIILSLIWILFSCIPDVWLELSWGCYSVTIQCNWLVPYRLRALASKLR